MPATLKTYPGLDPIDNLALPALEAGAESDAIQIAIVNEGDDDVFDQLVVLTIESLVSPNVWLATGLPPQDEQWARARLAGQDATAAPQQQDLVSPWVPLGAYAPLLVPNVLAHGIRILQLKFRVPGWAAAHAYRWRLAIVALEHSRALPPALVRDTRGILTGAGDRDWTALLRGGAVAASDPIDDQVHVAPLRQLWQGDLVHSLTVDATLDQDDGATPTPATLAAGESYLALVTAGPAGPVVTRGRKGAAPVRPAAPAGHRELAVVTVRFAGSGTEIQESDIEDLRVFDRYVAEPGTGLALRVHAGQAIGGGTWRGWTRPQTLALEADSVAYLYQLASGELLLAAEALPEERTALGPWYRVTTDGSEVTELVDLRTYAAPLVVVTLQGVLAGGVGEVAQDRVWEELEIEAVVAEISDNGGGASGATVLDLEVGGTTIYTSQGTDDQRPRFAFDAASLLLDDVGVHEVTRLHRGDLLTLTLDEEPTGGTPEWARVHLLCRRV